MLAKLFNSRTKNVASAAGLLGISALISRFLGLIRDRLLAGTFGAGEELDIYFAAFRIPDFVYGILIMGGVAAVFLPVFSEYFRKSEEDAWKFTNNLLNCFLILLVLLCAILALLTPWLVSLIAPGFSPAAKELTVALTRIMFISPILFGISSVFSGVLHYFDRFFAYSLAPVVYNLGIIFGILFLVPSFGLYGLAYGVILGAGLHWLFQIPAARNSGYKYLPLFNFRNFGLVKIFKLMVPRTIGAAAYHINLIVITAIASTLSAGSIAIFNLANNLQYFPVGLIGISFSVAAFPALARSLVADLKEEFSKVFSSTFRQILFSVVPVSILIFILRAQIVRIVLGTGQFGWLETRLTAASLALFSLGIFAAALVPFLARVFYSFQDTKTPLAVSLISMVLNVGLCFLFVFLLGFSNLFQGFIVNALKLQGIGNIGVIGLPLALSVSGIVQFFLLLFFLKKKEFDFNGEEIIHSLKRVLLASLLMAAVAYLCLFLAAEFLDTKTFTGILIQTTVACLAAGLAYLLAGAWLKSPEIGIIRSAVVSKFKKR
ncbi:MAG TPA: murein biosynthesis integral membrane protein MurJ [Patescibacteria group bacterium]|nr:murein biosynthesis integral membrane protein MurJ [Patescibacteria group bacterium]